MSKQSYPTQTQPVRPGTVLYGYCGGNFGRDEYNKYRVEFVAADYVVARDTEGRPSFAQINPQHLECYTVPDKEWINFYGDRT